MIILFLIGALGLGRFLVGSLNLTWRHAEAWALIVLLGYFFGAWTLLLACAVLGFGIGTGLALALLLATWLSPRTRRRPAYLPLATRRQTALWLATTGAFSLIIACILYRQMLEPGAAGAYSEDSTGLDLPLHLSIMTRFAYATHFTWRFSLMENTYLTYHFLIDFLSGMIVRWGGGLRLGLLLTSIPLCLALVQLVFFFGCRALVSVRAAALFTFLFLLNGSSFAVLAVISDYLRAHMSLWSFFRSLPNDYSNIGFYKFTCFSAHALISQRAFQFGQTVFCASMLLICRLGELTEARSRRRILLLVGFLIGLLPLAHVHSFFMSFAALLTLALFGRKTASLREWLIPIAASLVLAAPQLVYQLFSNRHAGFVQFKPGWTFTDSDLPQFPHYLGMFLYLMANFGVVLVLAAISYRQLKGCDMLRGLVLLGAALFAAAFLFVFQPLNYDNIKFFIYTHFFFCLPIALYLARMSRAGRWQWAPITALAAATGALTIVWQAFHVRLLYPDSSLREARDLRRRLPSDALVLTSTYIQHPLWSLAGQPVVEGDLFWMWSYGLPSQQVYGDVRSMYAGGDAALALLRKYKIQYVCISRYERGFGLTVNEPFYEQRFPLVYQRDGVDIYQIRRAS